VLLFAPIKIAYRFVKLLVTIAIFYLIVSGAQVISASNAHSNPTKSEAKATTILVMTPTPSAQVASPDLFARLQEARLLYEAKAAPRIFLASIAKASSGPLWQEAMQEDSVAKLWLVSQGIPTTAISGAGGSTSYQALKMAEKGIGERSSVDIVTDAINILWTSHAAAAAALKVNAIFPAAESKRFVTGELEPLWRETTGVAAGRIIGFSRTSWTAS
jgi:hypothetical protein